MGFQLSSFVGAMRRAILTSDTDPIEVWLVSTKNQANSVPEMTAASAQHLAMGAMPETPAPLSPGVLFKAEGAAHPTGLPPTALHVAKLLSCTCVATEDEGNGKLVM